MIKEALYTIPINYTVPQELRPTVDQIVKKGNYVNTLDYFTEYNFFIDGVPGVEDAIIKAIKDDYKTLTGREVPDQ